MRNRELTQEQAMDILHHVVAQKLRWGQQYDGSELGIDAIMEAMVVLAKTDNIEVNALKADLTKANRQLGASNARETKLKNKIEALNNEITDLQRAADDRWLSDGGGSAED